MMDFRSPCLLCVLTLCCASCRDTAGALMKPSLPSSAVSAPVSAVSPTLPTGPSPAARQQFVADIARQYGLEPGAIGQVLDQAVLLQPILDAVSHPAEQSKPWSEYRPIFVNPQQISAGQQFFKAHATALREAQQRTGVPAEMITAIIGVETRYGRSTGRYRVLDALYTLAFAYPPSPDPDQADRQAQRQRYFRDELGQFIVLCQEDSLPITQVMGSYAGAMGLGQFMPSSYRTYAVDANGDGRRDLFVADRDLFESIANYFKVKGHWQPQGLIAVPARVDPQAVPLSVHGLSTEYPLSILSAHGYHAKGPVIVGQLASPIQLDGATGTQYWLGFHNFYAITRYNGSPMYAMAVFQLAEAIAGRSIPAE